MMFGLPTNELNDFDRQDSVSNIRKIRELEREACSCKWVSSDDNLLGITCHIFFGYGHRFCCQMVHKLGTF
jgi:hypothetical protein